MPSLDQTRINSKIQSSLGVQHIRVQIQQAEAELEKAHTALADLPVSVRCDLLARQENALEALYKREEALTAQARKTAEGELRAERVDSLRVEAAPLLERAQKCLEIVRAELTKVAAIEREAHANGGTVMSEAFDQDSINYFIPKLELEPRRGTWRLQR
jgi:hypothetical protein